MHCNFKRKEQYIDAIQVLSYSTQWIKDYFAKYGKPPIFGSNNGDLVVHVIEDGKTILQAKYEMWIATVDGKEFFVLPNTIFQSLYEKIE